MTQETPEGDIWIRQVGAAGRITLTRDKALNALTPAMSVAIEAALDRWATDPGIALVIIDAVGERAFCAGGDIAEIYAHGIAGDHGFARAFWRQEYRLNAKIARFPRPVISFMQGFVMGGGVGVGCHARHRIVGESTRVAMPECGIGLVPDVGGTLLLARAPGACGEYLGVCAARMGPADALLAGFADLYIPQAGWADLIQSLEAGSGPEILKAAAQTPAGGALAANAVRIAAHFSKPSLAEIVDGLQADPEPFAQAALEAMDRNAPFAMACGLRLIRGARGLQSLEDALQREYRYSHRCQEQGDFLEGIRAMIIDKDRNPRWSPATAAEIDSRAVDAMLAPLGAEEWHDQGELA